MGQQDSKPVGALRRSRPGRRRALAALAVLLAVAAAVSAGLLAKYVMVLDRDAEMIAAGFHISSDYLKEPSGTPAKGPEREAAWNGDGTLAIELYNWEVENTDSASEVDISYKVTVTGGELASVKAGGAALSPESGSGASAIYLLPKARDKGDSAAPEKVTHLLSVKPTADSVTVKVEATAPYEKSLEATFDATRVQVRQVDAGGGVARLEIITNQYEGDLRLRWDKASFFPNAGVDERSFGWEVGYEGYADGSYAGGEAVRHAAKNTTYYFEFNSSTISSVTADFSSAPVSYDYPETGYRGATVNVT